MNPLLKVKPSTKVEKVSKDVQKQLEEEVEDYLVKRVHELGLDERKLNPQMCKGIPDRLVFAPRGDIMHQFAEIKRPSKSKRGPMQVYLAKGLNTIFINSKTEVEQFLMQYFTKYYRKPENMVE